MLGLVCLTPPGPDIIQFESDPPTARTEPIAPPPQNVCRPSKAKQIALFLKLCELILLQTARNAYIVNNYKINKSVDDGKYEAYNKKAPVSEFVLPGVCHA